MPIFENIHAVWFDAFWTLIDDSKRENLKEVFLIFKKYWLKLSNWGVVTSNYPSEIGLYYKKVFDYLFKIQWKGKDYLHDVSQEDKDVLKDLFNNELESYILREWTQELLSIIKQEVQSIFLISNVSSPYIKKVEELLPEWTFNFSLYSCIEWYKKTPDNTKIFDSAINRLPKSVKRDQILFTWDKNSNDLVASKNAWMQSVHIDKLRKEILNFN